MTAVVAPRVTLFVRRLQALPQIPKLLRLTSVMLTGFPTLWMTLLQQWWPHTLARGLRHSPAPQLESVSNSVLALLGLMTALSRTCRSSLSIQGDLLILTHPVDIRMTLGEKHLSPACRLRSLNVSPIV